SDGEGELAARVGLEDAAREIRPARQARAAEVPGLTRPDRSGFAGMLGFGDQVVQTADGGFEDRSVRRREVELSEVARDRLPGLLERLGCVPSLDERGPKRRLRPGAEDPGSAAVPTQAPAVVGDVDQEGAGARLAQLASAARELAHDAAGD